MCSSFLTTHAVFLFFVDYLFPGNFSVVPLGFKCVSPPIPVELQTSLDGYAVL